MCEKLSEGPSSQKTNKSGIPRIKFVDLNNYLETNII